MPDAFPLYLLGAALLLALAYFLPAACNICGADAPSFRRSLLLTLFVTAAAFFTFDGLGYGLMLSTRDMTGLALPPGYGYAAWLTEPLYLKWQVLGLIPVLRYLIALLALCLAAILYVLLLKTPYRVAMVVFLLQWVLSLATVGLVAFILTLAQGLFHSFSQKPGEAGQLAHVWPRGSDPQQRAATRPGHRPVALTPDSAAEGEPSLRRKLEEYQEAAAPALARLRASLDSVKEALEPYLEPIKEAASPYTRYLHPAVQEFLEDGGWWWVLLALAGVVLLWVRSLFRRMRRALSRKRKRRHKALASIREQLAFVGDALTELGPTQALVRDRPVRIRLMVMAPSISYVGDLLPEMAENLLDYVKPGLGEVVEHDVPRVRVWPRQASESQFRQLFFGNVDIPEARDRRSHWQLVAGTLRLGRQKVFLGLGVYADTAGDLREIRVEKENWEPVLGVRVSEPV